MQNNTLNIGLIVDKVLVDKHIFFKTINKKYVYLLYKSCLPVVCHQNI